MFTYACFGSVVACCLSVCLSVCQVSVCSLETGTYGAHCNVITNLKNLTDTGLSEQVCISPPSLHHTSSLTLPPSLAPAGSRSATPQCKRNKGRCTSYCSHQNWPTLLLPLLLAVFTHTKLPQMGNFQR